MSNESGNTKIPDPMNSWAASARSFFKSGATRPAAFRRDRLRDLAASIEAREKRLTEALHADLRKPPLESYATEIGWVLGDIDHALRNLESWMRPIRARTPLVARPGRSLVHPEPKGLVLIMSPWNYPVQLLLSPLVGAIAGGNTICLKPSELSPNVAEELSSMIRDTFEPDYMGVFEGGAEVAKSLLQIPFDHIFFTGSTAVGRRVMEAAARHPTPVTLELGGKSPCVVCADADVAVAARRIAWGKFINAGQTCVAPDYVLVERPVREELIAGLGEAIRSFFGEDPQQSDDYGRIINSSHLERLSSYLTDVEVIIGGRVEASDLYLAPTVLLDPPLDGAVMQEEIFGPILPVISVEDVEAAIEEINSRPHPLALYLFSKSREVQRRVREATMSGGMCVNDTLMQLFEHDLPFGGVGESGIGAYHGKAGFDTFTHARPVVTRSLRFDPSFRYPPQKLEQSMFKRLYCILFR